MFTYSVLIISSILTILILFFWLKKSAGFNNNKIAWVIFARVILVFAGFVIVYMGHEFGIIDSFEKFFYFVIIYAIITIILDKLVKKGRKS